MDTSSVGLADEVAAVLVEALSNVARHAHASQVTVHVEATADEVRLRVADDGVGLPDTGRRSGLANLAQRAGNLGGTFRAQSPASGGTELTWVVLTAQARASGSAPRDAAPPGESG